MPTPLTSAPRPFPLARGLRVRIVVGCSRIFPEVYYPVKAEAGIAIGGEKFLHPHHGTVTLEPGARALVGREGRTR